VIVLILLIIALSAASALFRPWIVLDGWSVELINLGLGALVGLVLTLPLWWLFSYRHSLNMDTLKRWWQATLLALVGAGGVALMQWSLTLLFGDHDAWRTIGGLLILLSLIVGLVLGAKGPMEWKMLWSRPSSSNSKGKPKLLDTSVIIDGRIKDLVSTGFIEGKLVLTTFVLQELHAVADSSDPLRRRKGRRGLDILGDLQDAPEVQIETVDQDFPQHRDVDHKLIELAKVIKADLLTTDYNLNKVAKVEGIRVLNINELANAIKPRYLPGEPLLVEILDRGEESGQGVGYLDDGTMVVVENGRNQIGKKVSVVVSSMLQTDAGKMLFVRIKSPGGRSTNP